MHAWHDCGYESEEVSQLLLVNGTSFEIKYCVATAFIIDDNNVDDNDNDDDDIVDVVNDDDAIGDIGDDDGDDIIVVIVVVIIGVVIVLVVEVGVIEIGVVGVEVIGVVIVGTKETNFDKFINISEILFIVVDKLFKVVDWLLAVLKSDLCISNNSLKVMEFIFTKSLSFSSWFIFIIQKKKVFYLKNVKKMMKKGRNFFFLKKKILSCLPRIKKKNKIISFDKKVKKTCVNLFIFI